MDYENCFESNGDNWRRPFIALGIALKNLGHIVTMVVPDNAVSLCENYKLDYTHTGFDYLEMISVIESKPPLRTVIELLDREISAPFSVLKELAAKADFIIGSARNYALQPIAELYNLPYLQVWLPPRYSSPGILPHGDFNARTIQHG